MPSHAATSSDEAPTPAFRGDASAGRNTVRFEDVVAVEPRCRTAVGSRRHARTSNRGANGAVYGRVPCCQQVGRDQVRGRDPPTIRTCAGLNAAPIRRPDAAGRSGLAPPTNPAKDVRPGAQRRMPKDAQGCPRTPKDPPRPPGSLGHLAGANRGAALVPSGPRRPGSAPPSQTIRATGASPTSRERGGERGGAKTRKNSGAEAGQLAATPTAVAAGPEMIEHRSPVHRGSPCSRIFVRRLFSSSLVSR